LSEFEIKLVHILGKKNIQADSLSRRPNLCPQGTDNKDVIVLPEHLFVNLIDMELQKKIANAKNMDYDAAEAIKELLKQGPSEAKKRSNGLGSGRIQRRKCTVLQRKKLCANRCGAPKGNCLKIP
jgi:hypothetical protein